MKLEAVRKPVAIVLLVLLVLVAGWMLGAFDHLVIVRANGLMYPGVREGKMFGIPILQYPTDLMIYEEMITELEPDLIVEVGTYAGGLTLYLSALQQQVVPDGKIVTLDLYTHHWQDTLQKVKGKPVEKLLERVEFIQGDSVSDEIVQKVKERASKARKVLIILDSVHSTEHVLKELQKYGPMVTVNSYIIVNDTFFDFPYTIQRESGPLVAVRKYLAETNDFVIDHSRNRFYVTNNPSGYLKRVR